MEFTKEEMELLEMYLLDALDCQRYEPEGIDKDTEKLYYKIKEQINLPNQVHEIIEKLKKV